MDTKVNESLKHKLHIQTRSILNDVDSKVATDLNISSKDLSKILEVVNSKLNTVYKAQVMLETLCAKDDTTLETHVEIIIK